MNNYLTHQYKMSAFGTKKPGGDVAVQLTFPSVYSSVYANGADRLAYYPSASEGVEHLPAGKDLQSLYHEQKRLDANRMAMAGVRSRAIADTYARAGNAGYGVMPKAVLSQRKFANPSNGNQSDIYAARYDQMRGAGEMTGGVLRTRKGQEYGREKLRGRIDQLNAIAEAKQGFLAGMPIDESIVPEMVEQGIPEPEGIKAKTELFGAISQFRSSVLNGSLDRIAISDFYKSLKLLFRVATVSDQEELGDLLEAFDEVQEVLRKEDFDRVSEGSNEFRLFKDLVEKIRAYIEGMLGAIQPKDERGMAIKGAKQSVSLKARKALSANLIRSLGLTKLPLGFKETAKGRRGEDGGDGGDEFSTGMPPGEPPYQSMPRFDPSPRDRFGARQGAWFGEDADEDEGEVGVRGITAPLNEMRAPLESAQMPEEEAEAAAPEFEVAASAPQPSNTSLIVIRKEDRGKYKEYEVDGRRLLIAANGRQYIQRQKGTAVYQKLEPADAYPLEEAEAEETAAAAPAPPPRTPAPTSAPPGESKAAKLAAAVSRYTAAKTYAPTGDHRRIIELRVEYGYRKSQKEIADEVGVSQSTVARVLQAANI